MFYCLFFNYQKTRTCKKPLQSARVSCMLQWLFEIGLYFYLAALYFSVYGARVYTESSCRFLDASVFIYCLFYHLLLYMSYRLVKGHVSVYHYGWSGNLFKVMQVDIAYACCANVLMHPAVKIHQNLQLIFTHKIVA